MGKTKDVSAFERGMVVGARRSGLSVSRTATLLGFSCSTISCVYQEWPTTQRPSSQLDTTVGSIGVNMDPRIAAGKRGATQYEEGYVLYTQYFLAVCACVCVVCGSLCTPYVCVSV